MIVHRVGPPPSSDVRLQPSGRHSLVPGRHIGAVLASNYLRYQPRPVDALLLPLVARKAHCKLAQDVGVLCWLCVVRLRHLLCSLSSLSAAVLPDGQSPTVSHLIARSIWWIIIVLVRPCESNLPTLHSQLQHVSDTLLATAQQLTITLPFVLCLIPPSSLDRLSAPSVHS